VERHEADGESLLFCCKGCLGAYLLITGAGLGAYYERRTVVEAMSLQGRSSASWDEADLETHVTMEQGGAAIDLLIDGIRCAACVWLNERLLEQMDGVLSARVNYATARARVVFDPARTTPLLIFQRLARAGYLPRPYTVSALDQQRNRERHDLLIRFATAFFLSMQLMAYSFALYAGYFQGMSPGMKLLMQLFSLAVTTPVVFYSGWPFLVGAWRGIVNRSPGMDLLIAAGALSSYAYSIYATLTGGEVYYETAAMIVTLILGGRLLENAARRRAASGIEGLLQLAPAQALLLRDGSYQRVETNLLRPGDIVMVPQGDRFPVDGTVAEGEAEVDESPATGESLPVLRKQGEPILAGSVNQGQGVLLQVTSLVGDSFIARIARLVEEAQSRKAPIQAMADRVAALFVPAVLLLAAGTLALRLAMGDPFSDALMTALAVVIIACPCALGLATPTAVLAGSGAAAAQGIIFRGGDVMEKLAGVTVALLDKTGTLTEGNPRVLSAVALPPCTQEQFLALAASLESAVSHPVASAIRRYGEAAGIVPAAPSEISSVPGKGVRGIVGGKSLVLGKADWLRESGILVDSRLQNIGHGQTDIHLAIDGSYAGSFVLSDRLRPEAAHTISAFARRGIKSMLVSGDRQGTASAIGAEAGIHKCRGNLLPEDKLRLVEKLQGRGEKVLMVGDGINDAAAISAADVGCALAGGTDIAIETSDLVLARADLMRLVTAHSLSVKTMGIIRQNLGWAFIYNIIGIPLAMAGLLTPIYAAAAMSVSSLCVVLNSLRLLRSPSSVA
jgi:Cu2+-exporting ATPase